MTDNLTLFDYASIPDDGILQSIEDAIFEGFSGSFQLTFGEGPPEAIPVTLTNLSLSIPSINLFAGATGPNSLVSSPETSGVPGVYDSVAGRIQFDAPVPCLGINSVFPEGKEVTIRPVLVRDVDGDPGEFFVLPSMLVQFIGRPVPVVSLWSLLALIPFVIAAATLLLRRRALRPDRAWANP